MANEEHLKILKQGGKVWNRWREENPDLRPDLSDADLFEADLHAAMSSEAHQLEEFTLPVENSWMEFVVRRPGAANLWQANLIRANLTRANLSGAELYKAHLGGASLSEANLCDANLRGANLQQADLRRADLCGTTFSWAELSGAFLNRADLNGADLRGARLGRMDLSATDLSGAMVGATVFEELDLRQASGLERIKHKLPSTIGAGTLARSGGQIPEVFLRGCGLSDWEIESAKLYRPGLSNEAINDILYKIHHLRAHQAVQINPLFISYSHADSPFVDYIETHLNERGVRFWRDIHDATSGRLEKQIDRAMRLNPTVLLVLSTNSTQSDWVEHEARLARKLEKELGRDVLCPVSLDDSWKSVAGLNGCGNR